MGVFLWLEKSLPSMRLAELCHPWHLPLCRYSAALTLPAHPVYNAQTSGPSYHGGIKYFSVNFISSLCWVSGMSLCLHHFMRATNLLYSDITSRPGATVRSRPSQNWEHHRCVSVRTAHTNMLVCILADLERHPRGVRVCHVNSSKGSDVLSALCSVCRSVGFRLGITFPGLWFIYLWQY